MNEIQKLIETIRSDVLVGNSTCSVLTECYDDNALISILELNNKTTTKQAIKRARQVELDYLGQGLEQRYGDDDDYQLMAYKSFKQAMKNNK